MSCKLMLTGLLTIVTVTFCAGRTLAQPGEKPASELEALSKQIGELKKSVEELKGAEIATKEKLNRIHRTIAELKLQVEDVQKDFAAMNKPGVVNTTAAKMPIGRISNYPSENGRIRLVNDFPYETAVVVNSRVYHVPPGQTTVVDVPTGAFTYQVLGSQPELLTRFVRPSGEFTIRTY